MKSKKDYHLARKAMHLSVGLALASVLYIQDTYSSKFHIMFTLLTLLGVSLDIFRLKSSKFNSWIINIIGQFAREEENTRISGLSFYFIGTSTALLFITPKELSPILLYVAIGDPMASLVGMKFNHPKLLKEKSLFGSLAFFICCLGINSLVFSYQRLDQIFALAVVATLSELFIIVDDNFSIIFVTSIACFFLN